MGPFTANAIRTLGSLPLLALVLGPRATKAALRSLVSEAHGWVLGAGFLTLTLVPYLWSLKYLPPTITTLTVYLTPLLVAAWAWTVHRKRPGRLLVPTVALTLFGGYWAVRAPGGAPAGAAGWVGLGLAILGVLGWTAYTIHLKHLTATRNEDELTLVAFLTSAVAFSLGALLFEGVRVEWTSSLPWWLLLYVLMPSVLSFFLYSRALKLSEATTIAVLLGVELVSTAIVSLLVTDEAFSPLKAAGLALVVLAVTAYLWDEARRTPRRPVPSPAGASTA